MDRPKTITSPETSIIIVDDTQEYAHILSRILQKGMGYKQVESFSSMEDAYDAISNEPDRFPIVFLDYHFPNGKTGTELLGKLRQNDLLDGRLVFFITAEPAVQKAIEANHNGAVGVIVKPFSTQALENLIKRVEHTLKLEQLGA
jgi:DNA-binding NtrC family response regulator